MTSLLAESLVHVIFSLLSHHNKTLVFFSLFVVRITHACMKPIFTSFSVLSLSTLASPALPPAHAVSPLHPEEFARELSSHPDQQRVAYVLQGLRHGFKLGFQSPLQLKPASRNKQSAILHANVIDDYLANEVMLGRVAGPFPSPPLPNLQISSFGVIPKRGQPGKWRLIVDLSSPEGSSVNDGIDPQEFTLQYIRLDAVIHMVARYGPGALMAKFDVEAAYRNIAVHPDDRFLLGMKWRDQYYVDLTLPFGLRSAPFIFNSVADMVEWILLNQHAVSDLLHYLDDFITAGPPHSAQCAYNLSTALTVCKSLGLPLHPNKCVGPTTTLSVLGIELDSVQQVARLPEEKLVALKQLIDTWTQRKWCKKQELESLIGHLHHAAKVVWPGRTFLRRLIDLLCCFRSRDHPIRINQEFRQDLLWWQRFLSSWHGVGFWLYPGLSPVADLEVTSDAAGSVGFGAYSQGQWFYGPWSTFQADQSIAYKELFPVVIAAHLWGSLWSRKHILFRSDNQAVVALLSSRTSKIPVLMYLLRDLLLSAARWGFSFSSTHVPGIQNNVADAISRFRWQEFRRLAPEAQLVPCPIPQILLDSLIPPY